MLLGGVGLAVGVGIAATLWHWFRFRIFDPFRGLEFTGLLGLWATFDALASAMGVITSAWFLSRVLEAATAPEVIAGAPALPKAKPMIDALAMYGDPWVMAGVALVMTWFSISQFNFQRNPQPILESGQNSQFQLVCAFVNWGFATLGTVTMIAPPWLGWNLNQWFLLLLLIAGGFSFFVSFMVQARVTDLGYLMLFGRPPAYSLAFGSIFAALSKRDPNLFVVKNRDAPYYHQPIKKAKEADHATTTGRLPQPNGANNGGA